MAGLRGCKCCKTAIHILKKTNWFHVDVDDASVDEAARKIIEVMGNASSTMLEKASVDDIKGLQAFTVRKLSKKKNVAFSSIMYNITTRWIRFQQEC